MVALSEIAIRTYSPLEKPSRNAADVEEKIGLIKLDLIRLEYMKLILD